MREHERAVHDSTALPPVVDRATFDADLDQLRAREKAHTREADAIAAQRRRLPMVELDASITVTGPNGPITLLEAFEGRKQLAYYFMRGVEVMDNNYALMDLTVYGRQEPFEDSPDGWPKQWATEDPVLPKTIDGRPISQWSRIEAGRSDELTSGRSSTN